MKVTAFADTAMIYRGVLVSASRNRAPQTAGDLIVAAMPYIKGVDPHVLRAIARLATRRSAIRLLDSQPYNLTAYLIDQLRREPTPSQVRDFYVLRANRTILGAISGKVLEVVKAMHDAQTPDCLDLQRLLRTISCYEKSFARLYPYIQQKTERVSSLTGGCWVFPCTTQEYYRTTFPNIDVARTVRLVVTMERTGSPILSARSAHDRTMSLIPLGAAMGWNVKPVRHPFSGDPVFGLDAQGIDISCLSPERLDAAAYDLLQRQQTPDPTKWCTAKAFMQEFTKRSSLYWKDKSAEYREAVELKIQPPHLRYADVQPYTWLS